MQDADGRREEAVYGAAEIIDGDGVVDGKGGYLSEGVDPGVRPARAGDVDRGALDAGGDFFEGSLDGWQAGLDLPAVKVGAVVGHGDADAAGHGFDFYCEWGE
jgi:hypothetical protein